MLKYLYNGMIVERCSYDGRVNRDNFTITEDMIRKLNPDRNIKEGIEELVKIKYPVEYKF